MKRYEQLADMLTNVLASMSKTWTQVEGHYWVKDADPKTRRLYSYRKDVMFKAVKSHNLTGKGLNLGYQEARLPSRFLLEDCDSKMLAARKAMLSKAAKELHDFRPSEGSGRKTAAYEMGYSFKDSVRFSSKDSFVIQHTKITMRLIVSHNNKAVLVFDRRLIAIVVKKTLSGVSIRQINTFPTLKDRVNRYVGLSRLKEVFARMNSVLQEDYSYHSPQLTQFYAELMRSYTGLDWVRYTRLNHTDLPEFSDKDSFNFVHVPIPKVRGMSKKEFKSAIVGYNLPKAISNLCSFQTLTDIAKVFDKNSINTLARAVKQYKVEDGSVGRLLTATYKLLFKYDSDNKFYIGEAPFTPHQLVREYMDTSRLNQEVPSLTIRSWKRMYEEHMRQAREISSRSTDKIRTVNFTLHNPDLLKDDRINVEVITDTDRLIHEGLIQHHCVGSYGYSINSGKCLVYSILYGDERYTLEITDKGMAQCRGVANKNAPTELMGILERYFEYPHWPHQAAVPLAGDYVPGDAGYRQAEMNGEIYDLPF